MLQSIRRVATLRLPRSALDRAFAIGAPLIASTAIARFFELATMRPEHVPDDAPLSAAYATLLSALQSISMGILLLAPLLAYLTRRRIPWGAGGLLALPLVYLALVLYAMSSGVDNPWSLDQVLEAGYEPLKCVALWWREIFLGSFTIGGLAAHFAATDRKPAPVRNVIVWCILLLEYLLAGLYLGYFTATHTPLTGEELIYAIRSPLEALVLTEGSVSTTALLVLQAPFFGLFAGLLWLRRRTRATPIPRSPGPAVHVGHAMWPAACVALALSAMPLDATIRPLEEDALVNLSRDVLVGPLTDAVTDGGIPDPSLRVPRLEVPEHLTAVPRGGVSPRLNVVVILMESMRADATSVYTPSLETTPFLAELARESLVVDRMYSVAASTSDAWIAVLTGGYPAAYDVVEQWARRREGRPLRPSLPHLLRTQGYKSAFLTTTSLDYLQDGDVVQAMQFDEIVKQHDIPRPRTGQVTPFGWEDRALLPPLHEWLDQRQAEQKPFFLTIMTNVGHFPYGLPAGAPWRVFPSANPQQQHYLNCAHYIDSYLREVVDDLRKRELLENTVLIVLGDHGEEFGEHGGFLRGHGLYEEVLHIPMLIRLPGSLNRRGHIEGLRQQIDVLPTIADALDLELQNGSLPGRSMLSNPGHSTLFFTTRGTPSYVAMREGDRKYMYNVARRSMAVFDLHDDPAEHNDLSEQVDAQTLRDAEVDLRAWRMRVRWNFKHQVPGG